MRTFSVRNFDRFQHYKDRSPPWIKLYNELLDDYDFGLLPDATKMHLVAIWLLASRSENKIPYDPRWVGARINATEAVDLDLLARHGFIVSDQPINSTEQNASKPLAKRLSREREEGEAEERQIGGGEETRARPKSLISEEAFDTSAKVLVAMGLHPEHPLSVGAPLTIQGWLNEHWNSECILVGVKRGMNSRNGDPPTTLKYFEKAIARAHAELTPSLPTVQIRQAETLTVTHGRNEKSGQISAAGSKLVESLKRGFGGAPSESYPSGGASDTDAGLLAYRGGQ